MYIHPYTQFGSIWMVNAFMFDHYTPYGGHAIPSIPAGRPPETGRLLRARSGPLPTRRGGVLRQSG